MDRVIMSFAYFDQTKNELILESRGFQKFMPTYLFENQQRKSVKPGLSIYTNTGMIL